MLPEHGPGELFVDGTTLQLPAGRLTFQVSLRELDAEGLDVIELDWRGDTSLTFVRIAVW